ncbi:MAG: hypothetical protein ACE1ZT_02400 [Dehalococcoidia bacterium]
MRIFTRVLPLALAATLFVLASACGSGGTGSTTSDQTDGQSSDLVSSEPLKVLSESAESFQDEVQSLEADLQFSINVDGLDIVTSAEMAFQAPDQMHMTMTITGLGEIEMLMLGTDIYMNVPPMGWIIFALDDLGLEELGLDAQTLQDAFSDHSFVDYAALVESVDGEVQDLGDETIDGGTYRHYRGTMDLADLSAAFNDAVGASEGLDLEDVSGPLTFDVWVDPDSYLPYKFTAGGEFAFGADAIVFDATMLFTSYNEPVEIPDAPQDAVSLGELFGGLLEGLEGFE